MRPDFLIIGAQKAGSTNFWHILDQHPEVAMTPKKELHYFTRYTNYPDHDWYRSQFEDNGKLTGEASPDYCFWPGALEKMHDFDADLRLIFILRNPVDRAISQYWMEFRGGYETLPINEALVPIEHMEATEQAMGLQRALYHRSYLLRGLYHAQLARIYEHFQRKQVFVGLLEEYIADHAAFASRLARFLGIAQVWDYEPDAYRHKGEYPETDPVMYAVLSEFFSVANEILFARHGIDTSLWS